MYKRKEKPDLTELIQDGLKGRNPNGLYIDQVVPARTLHRYDPQEVLEAAYHFGFLVLRCMVDKELYKANGVWIKPSPELVDKLAHSGTLGDYLCDKCLEGLNTVKPEPTRLPSQKTAKRPAA